MRTTKLQCKWRAFRREAEEKGKGWNWEQRCAEEFAGYQNCGEKAF
jgi:hypothetical protein